MSRPLPDRLRYVETQLQETQDELRALRVRCGRYHTALVGIASYSEGPRVTSTFDEPASASRARAALEEP